MDQQRKHTEVARDHLQRSSSEEIHRRQRGAFDSTVAVALLENGFVASLGQNK
jgi:hypothetical protein